MNSETQLYRQIHPNFIRGGRAGSRAFRPPSCDPYRLSAYDGDQTTADVAWKHYTNTLHKKSVGVMAVSVNECESLNLNVVADGIPYKEHVFVDFGDFSKGKIRKMARCLRAAAQTRGWLFQIGFGAVPTT